MKPFMTRGSGAWKTPEDWAPYISWIVPAVSRASSRPAGVAPTASTDLPSWAGVPTGTANPLPDTSRSTAGAAGFGGMPSALT